MTKLVYIDTNVYLDLLIGRHSGLMPNDEIARNILNRALKCEFHIIICDFLLMEIENHAKKETVDSAFKSLIKADKVLFEAVTSEDKRKAHLLSKNAPFGDCVHFVIAERCGAEYLVTNDKHFDKLKNKVKIIKPNLL
ncbi:MAG: type II toxin-antitoxin system VapC family toxin [Candidatus Nanoarchaeia archaeon]|nr:type II toxin-antitoxin system VapC family toxin [Candidatus Nanoarchaeia archaeon]